MNLFQRPLQLLEKQVNVLDMRHFDVQLGGIVLQECQISEMKTGGENSCRNITLLFKCFN